MRIRLKKYIFPILLCITVCIITLQNYVSGTYLIGWDSYQTDLYPWLGVKRALFSVWQEGQSFGLLAGMGHAADLVRAFFIWLMAFILPQSTIRYVFHTFILLSGVLGMYWFLKLIDFDNKKKVLAFIGALFYLLNFGSVQILFIPFESFSVMYGMFPWAIGIFLSIVSKKIITRKDWLIFLIINVLITPQGLSQQLFVVYVFVLITLAIGFMLQHRNLLIVRRVIFTFILIGIINSFWLLPQLYFLKTSNSVVKEAKANQLHTSDIFNQNLSKGNVADFVLMKGFHFDLLDTGKNDGLFQEWKNHFNEPLIIPISFFLAVLPIIGLFSRRKFHLSFVLCYLFIAQTLLLDTFPFSLINHFLRTNEFFNQVFRSPFTKFIIPYSLIVSYLLVVAVDNIILFVFRYKKIGFIAFSFTVILCIVIYSFPSFYGYYFSPKMKVAVPEDYFELMHYLRQIGGNKRITLLPDYTFWGWTPYKWGYIGSGFLWYGLEQPIISRTFDTWSLTSESYFWQMKSALEAEDISRFEKILEKYNISYLLLDNSLLSYSSDVKSLQYDRTKKLLSQSSKITLVKKTALLELYEYLPTKAISIDFISSVTKLPNIGPAVKVTNNDIAYMNYGAYQTNSTIPYQRYLPFLGMTSETRTKKPQWLISEANDNFLIETEFESSFQAKNYYAIISEPEKYDLLLDNGTLENYLLSIDMNIGRQSLVVSFPKKIIKEIDIQNTTIGNWNNRGFFFSEKKNDSLVIKGYDFAQPNITYLIPSLNQQKGYLVLLENKRIIGDRPYFIINDMTKEQRIIEDKLQDDIEYYMLPPHFQYGTGYSVTFYNYSYPSVPIENEIKKITIFAYPYNQIENLEFIDGREVEKSNLNNDLNISKNNYYSYQINNFNINSVDVENLVLWQSFDPGWHAYQIQCQVSGIKCQVKNTFPFLFGEELKNHVLVNNWANGWISPKVQSSDELQVKIIYLPQYLEYVGFGLMIVGLIWLVFWYRIKA